MVTEAIKPGYRRTEVGVIPEDWNVQNILDNSTLKARIGWQGLTTAEYLDNGNYFLVTGTDFNNGRIDWDNCFYVDEKRYSQDKNIQIRKEDILVTKDGTIGKIAYIDNLPSSATLNSGVFVIRPKDKNYVPLFFFYILSSDYFYKFLNKLKAGSTISHLYQKDFVSFDFVLPKTKEEQSAIAQALSDTDAMIESLNKLIAKKKNIKRGAMQELLTGKRRLPGFKAELEEQEYKQTEIGLIPKDWDFKKVDEIAEVKSGKRLPLGKTLTDKETKHPYIRVIDMYQGGVSLNDIKYVPEDVFPKIKNYRIFKEDIFISVAGTLGIVGKIPVKLDGANLTENADRLTNIKCNRDFLLWIFLSSLIQKTIESERTLGAQPKLALTRIKKFFVPIPKSREEQSAIAQVLSDMDAEIEELEQKRDKYIMIKKGMMQQLLTGKIRLKWQS